MLIFFTQSHRRGYGADPSDVAAAGEGVTFPGSRDHKILEEPMAASEFVVREDLHNEEIAIRIKKCFFK